MGMLSLNSDTDVAHVDVNTDWTINPGRKHGAEINL